MRRKKPDIVQQAMIEAEASYEVRKKKAQKKARKEIANAPYIGGAAMSSMVSKG